MKSTGIVRRIDDLGRVVIPREVRRTMHIKEGDPLELFMEGEYVCFKRYDSCHPIRQCLETLQECIADDALLNVDQAEAAAIRSLVMLLNKNKSAFELPPSKETT
jgi:AbrB family looped-hinge helix DNA binding protein